jgi:predicted TPR repeat methyltransferase
MTGQDPSPPGRKRVITYWQAQDGYRGTIDARERFDELTNRDLSVRAFAMLKARGTYDPVKHGDAEKYQPLTASEHLEILAAGEMLARHYRHPAGVDEAVKAGASWSQVAEAVGSDEAQVRQQYREWADGQHHLHTHYMGKFGMNDAEHASAIRRASEPPAGPEVEREAEQ